MDLFQTSHPRNKSLRNNPFSSSLLETKSEEARTGTVQLAEDTVTGNSVIVIVLIMVRN